MRKISCLYPPLFAVVLLISVGPVRAQSVLWVGPNGSDGNACSQTSPCATFQGAINKGNVTKINCLASGSYGIVTIAGSLTIDCGTGNVGNVDVSTTASAISVITAAAAKVSLRHLSLNSIGTAPYSGIDAISFFGGTLTIEDCEIQGFGTAGMFFGTSSARGDLQISNSKFTNNLGGLSVVPQNGQIATVALDKVHVSGNQYGIDLGGKASGYSFNGVVAGTLRDSVVAGNLSGVIADASQVFFTVEESSIIANTTVGIQTNSAGSVLNVGASTIGGNGTGVLASQGSIISFGNNQMSTNGANGNFTSTVPLR